MPWHQTTTTIALLLFTLSPLAVREVRPQPRVEEFRGSRSAYGITYDGTNFWYSDPSERRIVRLPPTGRGQSFRLGNQAFFGMAFNPADGFLYVGSERKVLRVNTVTGGLDSTIPIAIPEIGGIAFGPSLWYLLERGTGILHYYDPKLARIVSTMALGISSARDVTTYRGNVWATDGRDGILYRFSPDRKVLTGSLRGPLDELRGLAFAEGQLWIVNRRKQTLERLPYTETERYIASGERKYPLNVKITFNAPAIPGGRLVALTPPSTESQKARGITTPSEGWSLDAFTASGERVFSRQNALPGEKITLEYKVSITSQNVRYLIPEDFAPGPEKTEGNSALTYYFDGSESSFQNDDPYVVLKAMLIAEKLPLTAADKLLYELKTSSLPSRWTSVFRIKDAKATATMEPQAYLRGYGWVPLNPDPEGRLRVFERRDDTIELYRQPDTKASGTSAVYHVNAESASGARDMTSIPAVVEVTLAN